nr:hypothetical protein [Agaricicola taiwanensis]
MQLDHTIIVDAGRQMQVVDILCDDAGEMLLRNQPGHQPMAAIGLGAAIVIIHGELAPPGLGARCG